MRMLLAGVIGAMVLMSGCSSGGEEVEGPKPEEVKASVDDLATKVLPALAKEFDGEFPLAQGKFVGCGAGRDVRGYAASGELQAQVADNAKAAQKIRATLADADIDATIRRDSTVTATVGDVTIRVGPNVAAPNSFVAIRPLTIASECHTFSESDVARIGKIKPEVYGEPVTGEP